CVFLTVNLPLLIGSRSFLVLIFAFPIRVCERQRPFNHSCARGLAFELLENVAQPSALGGGNDGQRIALVIRASLRAELRPRDSGCCRRGISRILCRCCQTEKRSCRQRNGAKDPRWK